MNKIIAILFSFLSFSSSFACYDLFVDQKFMKETYINKIVSVDGQMSLLRTNPKGETIYVNFNGETALKYQDNIMAGQGFDQHAHGFSSPVGRLKSNPNKAVESLTENELKTIGIEVGSSTKITYKSGITVEGDVTGIVRKREKNIIFTFENATVKNKAGDILFDPTWGTYDMLVMDKLMLNAAHKRNLVKPQNEFFAQRADDIANSFSIKLGDVKKLKAQFEKIINSKAKLNITKSSIKLSIDDKILKSLSDKQIDYIYDFQKFLENSSANPNQFLKNLEVFTSMY